MTTMDNVKTTTAFTTKKVTNYATVDIIDVISAI